MYQDFGNAAKGKTLWYSDIEERLKEGLLVETSNEKAETVSAYDRSTKMFVNYDSPKTVQIKACYSTYKGLGSLMTWLLYGDKLGKLLDAAHLAYEQESSLESVDCKQYSQMLS